MKEIWNAFKSVSDTQLTIEPLSVTDTSTAQITWWIQNVLLIYLVSFFYLHTLKIKQFRYLVKLVPEH